MAKDYSTLGWDYAMFVAFIAFSTVAPLWSRLRGKKKAGGKADYVFATGSVSVLAMMLSIARGTLGIRAVLGYPSELFYRGSAMWEVIYGMVNAYPIVCFIFVPVYFNLGITSVYQYVDLRFKSRLVRCLASATYILRQILSLGVTVYTPSVALATVIGIPYWASIVGMSAICILFTILGGLKAAINADVIQSLTVILVTLAVIIQGAIDAGGPATVFNRNLDNGRLKFMNFTGDMTVRVDTLSAWLGQLFMSLSQFGCQQNFMQRYASMKSLRDVNRVLMSNIPVIIVFFSLSWIAGMVVYAVYVSCDPLAAGYITKPDEILPFFVEDRLSFIPGFLGIFMATLFNGALSLNVSNLQSLATVVWEDFLSQMPQFKGLSDKQQLSIIKVVGVIFGILTMGIAFCVGLLSGVIESSMLAFSATSGPLLGVFVLAMLIPIANWKGASAGMIISHILIIWLTFGSFTVPKPPNSMLPTSTESCDAFNFSSSISKPATSWLVSDVPKEALWSLNDTYTTTQPPMPELSTLQKVYSVSYMYYSLIGTAITVIIGVLVSYATQNKEDNYDSNLLHPLIFKWSQCFSGEKPYYVRKNPPENSNPRRNRVQEHDNPGFEESVDDHTASTAVPSSDNDSNQSTIYPATAPDTNPPSPTTAHPDIMECKHWEGKTGVYRKRTDGDMV